MGDIYPLRNDSMELNIKTNEYTNQTPIEHSRIARALARGYTDLYYVNMETDELIEYHTDDENGVLTEVRRSADFFEGCKRDVKLFVHPDDQEKFVTAMDRDFLTEALKESKVYEMTYRRIKDGKTFYVDMKVSRIEDDDRFVVIAVSDIDELMKRRQEEERIQEERIIYARLQALVGNFIVVYVVNPETDEYREFSATDEYSENFAQAQTGKNFFEKVREVAHSFNHHDDLDRFLSVFTKENVMEAIERNGVFSFGYRLMKEGTPIYVQMKAAMVEEKEGSRLVVGLNDIDAQVRQERALIKQLAEAQAEASIDALTGVRNKHAYLETEVHMDQMIYEHSSPAFAIVMMDVNDLKKVNDSAGHQAGDQYLRSACKIICDIFKHSPVFRVGGDEFAVIAQGVDYENIEERIDQMSGHNAEAKRSGGIVIACGMSKFDNDACVASVFERADNKMYINKNSLKEDRQRA
jgi:diguanylate cyclase (GGDEF)-like protein